MASRKHAQSQSRSITPLSYQSSITAFPHGRAVADEPTNTDNARATAAKTNDPFMGLEPYVESERAFS